MGMEEEIKKTVTVLCERSQDRYYSCVVEHDIADQAVRWGAVTLSTIFWYS